jgi:hypothetical protein
LRALVAPATPLWNVGVAVRARVVAVAEAVAAALEVSIGVAETVEVVVATVDGNIVVLAPGAAALLLSGM